ncbi:biopolymer transporter ExbD [Marivita sp. GX14005]|uniref:ExbD/TolR family protein n=1 Tax=Marivita sp. GX14005 TaxID=2942276 RepID=UPI00201845D7|nr:biopolymer transporter ExbD [Marivita sp. GX14005]MCL3882320.1 biopolymer transporter ExbD [Marivita sp. GX14005]
MLDLAPLPARRRIGLTPMIDVVFLLLVFFMLAARFGVTEAIPLALPGGTAAAYEGPPRLVSVGPRELRVNGIATADPVLALRPLMTAPSDLVILRPEDGARVQRLLDVMEDLRAAGLSSMAVLE